MNNDIKIIMENRVEGYPEELAIDAVGLWQIIGDLDEFDLSDDEFKEHLKNVILSLMKNGAVPVVSGKDSYAWAEISTYGRLPEDIANNISTKWSKNYTKDRNSIFDLGGVWFARPIPDKKYVKLLEN